jgi:hypothetical protein
MRTRKQIYSMGMDRARRKLARTAETLASPLNSHRHGPELGGVEMQKGEITGATPKLQTELSAQRHTNKTRVVGGERLDCRIEIRREKTV